MPDPYRIVTSPLSLTGALTRAQFATLVAADALVRRAQSEGRKATWTPPSLAGDVTSQLAVDRDLARAGLDRATIGRDAYLERVREHEANARDAARQMLSVAGVDADLDAGAADLDAAARAARTAFVRLYDAGLLVEAERVVDVCSRCGTVVDPVDADVTDVEATSLAIRVPLTSGAWLDVDVITAELLPGVVAIAVPEGHEADGQEAVLPVVGRTVPVVTEPGIDRPEIVVPAHDPVALDTARRLGLVAIEVLDDDAVARAAPLDGLARYAARAAATDLLVAEGAVLATHDAVELVGRCRRCGTVLLPRLGRYWFLAFDDLAAATADAVREGIVFTPDAARQSFLDAAVSAGWWCLSHRAWAGQRVPVARCVDCGSVAVAVEIPESCGKCMGALEADDTVLDARFVGAVWALADVGWPDDESAPVREAPCTTLLVGRHGITRWAIPIAALGLRLAGVIPFSTVAATEVVDASEPVDVTDAECAPLRVAALRGDFDLAVATADVALLRDPPVGDADVEPVVAICEQAFAVGAPGSAIGPLVALAEAGVRATDRLRALASPLIGD